MSKIIALKDVLNNNSVKLIIYCLSFEKINKKPFFANKPLAEGLIKYDLPKRAFCIEECVFNYIEALPDNPLICSFDVLFNPAYNIDILKIFISLRKRINFELAWSGTFNGNSLIYAEYGYKDYHSYKVNDYDIICVI